MGCDRLCCPACSWAWCTRGPATGPWSLSRGPTDRGCESHKNFPGAAAARPLGPRPRWGRSWPQRISWELKVWDPGSQGHSPQLCRAGARAGVPPGAGSLGAWAELLPPLHHPLWICITREVGPAALQIGSCHRACGRSPGVTDTLSAWWPRAVGLAVDRRSRGHPPSPPAPPTMSWSAHGLPG